MLALSANALMSAASAPSAPPQIPVLRWEERSDWINAKTDIAPAAIGDGQTDDTVAVQNASAGLRDGSVLYFPAGTYRITAPLSLRNPTGVRWIGGLIVGNGRETKWVWDGASGGTMLLLNGIAHSRFVGLELDGQDRAGVGFHYRATQGFQTEVTHRHLAFRGFTNAAVLEDHTDEGQALAETTFENCLFEDCDRGVAFLRFNDYDYTFDGCEFRGCGVAIDCDHGKRDNHNIVMSDFYVEQADNGYVFEGAADDPPGRATLTGAKFHSFASTDQAKNTLLEVRGYHGQIAIGPYQFYQEPKRMRMNQEGPGPVDLLLWASSWYGAKPDPQLGPAARLSGVGNEFYGTAPEAEAVVERMFFQEAPSETALTQLSRALDDLRRLGEGDLRLNHPEVMK